MGDRAVLVGRKNIIGVTENLKKTTPRHQKKKKNQNERHTEHVANNRDDRRGTYAIFFRVKSAPPERRRRRDDRRRGSLRATATAGTDGVPAGRASSPPKGFPHTPSDYSTTRAFRGTTHRTEWYRLPEPRVRRDRSARR